MGKARTPQDDQTSATQDQLRALVRLLALRAAQDFVSSSLTVPTGEDHPDAPHHTRRS